MKRITVILNIFLLSLIVVLLQNNLTSIPHNNQTKFSGIGSAGKTSETCWIEAQNDDNALETKHQSQVAQLDGQLNKVSLNDHHIKPFRQMLLNPLFLDKPPPASCN